MTPAEQVDIQISGPVTGNFAEILTPAALDFLAVLSARFEPQRQELLKRREARQRE